MISLSPEHSYSEMATGPFGNVVGSQDNLEKLGFPCKNNSFFFFFGLVAFSRATVVAYGGSQARDLIGAIAADLCHSYSDAGSEPHLQPTPQLMATPGP